MTRAEYLAELNVRLAALPEEERASAIGYYVEFFDDAGPDAEQQVIERLGTPEHLARQLIGDTVGDRIRPLRQRKRTVWMWILIVLASPILVTLGAVALGLLLTLLICVFMVLLSLAMVAVVPMLVSASLLLCGIFAVLMSIPVGFGNIATSLWYCGMGLLVGAAGALLFKPSLVVLQRAMRWIFTASAWIMRQLRRLRRLF